MHMRALRSTGGGRKLSRADLIAQAVFPLEQKRPQRVIVDGPEAKGRLDIVPLSHLASTGVPIRDAEVWAYDFVA